MKISIPRKVWILAFARMTLVIDSLHPCEGRDPDNITDSSWSLLWRRVGLEWMLLFVMVFHYLLIVILENFSEEKFIGDLSILS